MNLRANLSKIDAIFFENIDVIGTIKSFIIKNIPNHIITIILSQNALLKSQWPGMLLTSSGRTETIKRLRIRIQHQAWGLRQLAQDQRATHHDIEAMIGVHQIVWHNAS